MKSPTSATRAALTELSIHWMLLLSGTPVQNNMKELQGLMSLLDADKWGDQEDFLEQFGEEAPSLDQIKELQVGLMGVAAGLALGYEKTWGPFRIKQTSSDDASLYSFVFVAHGARLHILGGLGSMDFYPCHAIDWELATTPRRA